MTSQTRRILKISAIVLSGLLAIAILVIGGIFVNFYNETRHPLEARTCECDLLKQWAANLTLTPQGDNLEPNEVTIDEGTNVFRIRGSGLEDMDVDRQAILEVLTGHGLNSRVDLDQLDQWNVIFYPGGNISEGLWSFDVTSIETGIGINIDVTVDGSPWGLETIEDVHDFYVEDHQAALAAQDERQHQAIETLQPLRQALNAMIHNG